MTPERLFRNVNALIDLECALHDGELLGIQAGSRLSALDTLAVIITMVTSVPSPTPGMPAYQRVVMLCALFELVVDTEVLKAAVASVEDPDTRIPTTATFTATRMAMESDGTWTEKAAFITQDVDDYPPRESDPRWFDGVDKLPGVRYVVTDIRRVDAAEA